MIECNRDKQMDAEWNISEPEWVDIHKHNDQQKQNEVDERKIKKTNQTEIDNAKKKEIVLSPRRFLK